MTYKLTYFDLTGRAEPIRFLLSYGGIDFEDIRVDQDTWKKIKSDFAFGQLPVLEYNGKVSHQSIAICRYVAKQVKLVGKDDWEDLEIDAAVDTISDVLTKIFVNVMGKQETFKEQFDKEDIIFILTKLEEQIKNNNGYLALGRLTWADFVFVAFMLMMISKTSKDLFVKYPNIEELIRKVQDIPQIKEWLAKHPE